MSTELKETFDKAVKLASSPEGGKWSLTTAHKSTMYGCFKKVTVGDVQGERPGMFSIVARQKWDAWKDATALSEEEAMNQYIAVVEQFVPDLKA